MKLKFVVALIAGVFLLTACSSDDTTRNEDGEIVEGGELGVFAVQEGDCINFPDADDLVDAFDAVACDEPHDGEIYELFDIEGFDDFPGDAAVSTEGSDGCLTAFETFVGIDYNSSIFFFTFFSPTEDTWNELDDREVICVLTPAEGEPQLVGSAEGTAQ